MFAPDTSASFLAWLLAPASIGVVWLGGHLACRAFPSPSRPLTDTLAGLFALFFTVLVCDALAIPITFLALALGQAVPAALGATLARRLGIATPTPATDSIFPGWKPLAREAWWALPCLAAFVSVVARGAVDPLAGWDNVFRWNHLALLMRDAGSLAAYPPVTDADFGAYPWCDGIPPLVPVFNLWIYLFSGSSHGGLVAFRLALELGLAALAVWTLARDYWGPAGARFALLALAGCSLFLASVSIAQETGLAGIGILLFAVAARAWQKHPSVANALWLALGAAFAALCRDYNLLYPPAVIALLVVFRAPRRHILAAAVAMILVAGPWYARNWMRTGHPFYAHHIGELFPGNAYHDYFMSETRRLSDIFATPGALHALALALLAGSCTLILASIPGWLRLRSARATIPLLLPAAIATSLCVWALPSTAGGLVYSLRALGPALPLIAVLAGAWALVENQKIRAIAAALLIFPAADAARRHWLFFLNPIAAPLPYTWREWRTTDSIHSRFSRMRLWRALSASATGRRVVVDNPTLVVLAAHENIALTPLQSPALAPALTAMPPGNATELRRSLREAGVRFVVLDDATGFGRAIHSRHPNLGPLYGQPPTGYFEGLRIYDLDLEPPVVVYPFDAKTTNAE